MQRLWKYYACFHKQEVVLCYDRLDKMTNISKVFSISTYNNNKACAIKSIFITHYTSLHFTTLHYTSQYYTINTINTPYFTKTFAKNIYFFVCYLFFLISYI